MESPLRAACAPQVSTRAALGLERSGENHELAVLLIVAALVMVFALICF